MGSDRHQWISVLPTTLPGTAEQRLLKKVARKLSAIPTEVDPLEPVARIRSCFLEGLNEYSRQSVPGLTLAINVLCDLRGQGWTFRIGRTIEVRASLHDKASPKEKKNLTRTRHLVERDAQLRQASVRKFVRSMESPRPFRGEWKSIFSVMRDGKALADELRMFVGRPNAHECVAQTVSPYVQVVDADTMCGQTGLRLADIWRYFRFTWSTPHQSTPGRKMAFLIRDAAVPNHPIIGIGALGSSVVQLSVRDDWIGWSHETFERHMRESPSLRWARWLNDSLNSLLEAVHKSDLARILAFSTKDLEHPSQRLIVSLRELGASERKLHELYPSKELHKSTDRPDDDASWKEKSTTRLFRSKRALALAQLLEARLRLNNAGFTRPTTKALIAALNHKEGAKAINTVRRFIKASHAGIDMMDITVCGAIAPYNELLGGKLVAMLMASPDVRRAYESRYSTRKSLIASSMAARAVTRPPRLVLMGTTSLYSSGSSQYNRIRVPTRLIGGMKEGQLAFICLGETMGYGSYHFSKGTMDALESVLRQRRKGRQVNSIFGEGVSPKFRKVRDALDAIGLPADELLQHGSPRLVYAIPLAHNFREVLVGIQKSPSYILPFKSSTTAKIGDYWITRWVLNRILRSDVLERIERATLAHPITHAARVSLPQLLEDTLPLFD